MTWKNVFDAMKICWAGGMPEAFDAARAAGYQYISWNGWVYDAKTGQRTDTLTENLQ
jgi:hypothetical protein